MNRFACCVIAIGAAIAVSPCDAASSRFPALQRAANSEARTALEAIRVENRVPALAGAVADGRGVLIEAACGERIAGSGEAVGPRDAFHIGSCTKSMTAVLIAMLVADGTLSWDAPLARLAPDIADAASPEYRHITLRQLLGHRAGVQPYTDVDDDTLKAARPRGRGRDERGR